MSRPLVSVIIPTFNRADYIGLTIESVLAQTYENWELAIVDDGSEDDTPGVVARYRDPRVRYMRQPRRGVERLADTINVGVAATSGEFLTMLGSDDVWPADRIERQLPAFADTNVVLVFGRGVLIDSAGSEICEYPLPSWVQPVMNRPVGSILGSLMRSNWLPQYTVLIRRSALMTLGGYIQPPPLLAEDYPTHLELAQLGEFRFVDARLGFYRMHRAQATNNMKMEMTRRDVEYVRQFFSRLSPAMRERSGLSAATLDRVLGNTLNNCFFEEGRRKLLHADWRGARAQFMTALRRGSLTTKAKALVGLGCAAMRRDMEGVARTLGRPSLA